MNSSTGVLLCVGLTTVDVVALPVHFEPSTSVRLIKTMQMSPAGTAAGAALVAARLGVPTQLAGAVADDAMGRFVMGELKVAGIDASLMSIAAAAGTSATLIAIDGAGERMIYHAPGAAMGLQITPQTRTAARSAAAVHYAGIGLPNLDGGQGVLLLSEARECGAWLTCDLIAPGPHAAKELRRVLPYVDVFLPSAVEARYVTGESDLGEAARALKHWGATAVVIKNGADGVVALDRHGKLDSIPAVPVQRVVDTTSCGDSFCAGFIAATLRGRSWLQALQFAAATASLVARGPATLGMLDCFEQVDAVLSTGAST